MSRSRILLGIGLLAVALTCVALADTSARPAEEIAGSCGDWWCAKRNAVPIGFAILFGGLGAAMLGLGFVSGPDAEAEDEADARLPAPMHDAPERFARRPRR